jgi:hypothetical protein
MRCDVSSNSSSEEVSMHSMRSLSSECLMSISGTPTVDQWQVKLAQNGRKVHPVRTTQLIEHVLCVEAGRRSQQMRDQQGR